MRGSLHSRPVDRDGDTDETRTTAVSLVAADAVTPGAIVDATVGDRDLVVWRTVSGRPCVMEARCPHQWSHLGAEGVVDGDEIVCLTHMWRFGLSGDGWKVAMNGRRDRKGDIEVFACREVDGAIVAEIPDADTAR